MVYSEMKNEYDESNIYVVGTPMGSGVSIGDCRNDPERTDDLTPYYRHG